MSPVRFDPAHEPAPLGRLVASPPRALGYDHQRVLACEISQYTPGGSDSSPFLSVIVPAKNEAESLAQLVDEIVGALRAFCQGPGRPGSPPPAGFEIIVINDGSTDPSTTVLAALAETIPELRVIHLRISAGQSAATAAGLHAAQGDWIATLDADLQNDPADLVTLWNALPGYDVVLGWRAHRSDTWSKRIISNLANRIRNALLGQSIRDTGCSVRLLPRSLALRLPLFHGVHRFWGPLLLRERCRLVQVPVHHRPRVHGRSHYNLWNRSLTVLVDLFGVAWLMNRPLCYEVRAENGFGALPTSNLVEVQPARWLKCQEVA
jgi:dolichol-phosphate mannosyltransferase